jgi:hypothetical protein
VDEYCFGWEKYIPHTENSKLSSVLTLELSNVSEEEQGNQSGWCGEHERGH